MPDDPSTTSAADISASPATPTPAVETAKRKGTPSNPYIWGTGRRKRAVARVRIRPGKGEFLINDRKVDAFFCIERDRAMVHKPLEVTGAVKSFDVFVNVVGGGITGQAGAVMLGLARALVVANSDYALKLREHNLLTRDPRRVERKKYGQPGARKRFQFSKR